jgi:hypothetical protein
MQLVNRNIKQLRKLCTNGQLTLFRAFPFRLIIIIIIIIIIIKSFRKYVINIPENNEVKKLQKTAILGTAHMLRKVLT